MTRCRAQSGPVQFWVGDRAVLIETEILEQWRAAAHRIAMALCEVGRSATVEPCPCGCPRLSLAYEGEDTAEGVGDFAKAARLAGACYLADVLDHVHGEMKRAAA